MRQKKNCNNCPALIDDKKCQLKYDIHIKYKLVAGAMIPYATPNEPCPKPKTNGELLYCIVHNKKQ